MQHQKIVTPFSLVYKTSKWFSFSLVFMQTLTTGGVGFDVAELGADSDPLGAAQICGPVG